MLIYIALYEEKIKNIMKIILKYFNFSNISYKKRPLIRCENQRSFKIKHISLFLLVTLLLALVQFTKCFVKLFFTGRIGTRTSIGISS